MIQIPGLSIQIKAMLDKMLLGGATLREALILQYYKYLYEVIGLDDVETLYRAGWTVRVEVYEHWFHMTLVPPIKE